MASFSKKEVMNSARDIIMFPKRTSTFNPNMNTDMYSNYPTDLGSPLGIPRVGIPSRGSLNLGQPTAGGSNYPSNFNPLAPSGVLPQRGANGGTVYVNSLGQLSTDDDAGFDPKRSFILRTDKDSTFDQDIRIPSNSFDTLKGIGNSYSFGFPGSNNAPIRGSADLSEPVDPLEYLNYNERFLTPQNRKQIYTYPHDAQSQGFNNFQPILHEHTGQINTKLAAQSPKYLAPQVYGPPATQTQQNIYSQPRLPVQSQPQGFQPGPGAQPRFQQPQRLYQNPHQTVNQQNSNLKQKSYQPGQNQPIRLYQQPPRLQQIYQPISQQPQGFRQQNQQQIERRLDNVPQNNYQTNGQQLPQIVKSIPTNQQRHKEYLRNFLKDKTYLHHDNMMLVELIQRLFVPPSTNTRVVSADVQPSEGDSFSFTYDEEEPSHSNSNSNHQSVHQHSGTCGHQQGY